jgi:hypothetical protein
MKRISRFALMMLFSLLVLGSTRAFAGSGGNGNNQGNNNNQGGNSGGLINWIENLIKDIFDDGNNQGNNQGNDPGNWDSGTTSGGGTAPIDGGISLLMIAGAGLGVKKMVKARQG